MGGIETILRQMELTRKRSILVFEAIPPEHWHWRFDTDSMTLIETVRHILDCDRWYMQNIVDRDSRNLDYDTMFGNRPYVSVDNEMNMNTGDREQFIQLLRTLTDQDLDEITIRRLSGNKPLGEFLEEIIYHEAYHTGQLQFFLRMLDVPRPNVWL